MKSHKLYNVHLILTKEKHTQEAQSTILRLKFTCPKTFQRILTKTDKDIFLEDHTSKNLLSLGSMLSETCHYTDTLS